MNRSVTMKITHYSETLLSSLLPVPPWHQQPHPPSSLTEVLSYFPTSSETHYQIASLFWLWISNISYLLRVHCQLMCFRNNYLLSCDQIIDAFKIWWCYWKVLNCRRWDLAGESLSLGTWLCPASFSGSLLNALSLLSLCWWQRSFSLIYFHYYKILHLLMTSSKHKLPSETLSQI